MGGGWGGSVSGGTLTGGWGLGGSVSGGTPTVHGVVGVEV